MQRGSVYNTVMPRMLLADGEIYDLEATNWADWAKEIFIICASHSVLLIEHNLLHRGILRFASNEPGPPHTNMQLSRFANPQLLQTRLFSDILESFRMPSDWGFRFLSEISTCPWTQKSPFVLWCHVRVQTCLSEKWLALLLPAEAQTLRTQVAKFRCSLLGFWHIADIVQTEILHRAAAQHAASTELLGCNVSCPTTVTAEYESRWIHWFPHFRLIEFTPETAQLISCQTRTKRYRGDAIE